METAWAAEAEVPSSHASDEAQKPEALLSFWVEQGLTHAASAKLLDEIRCRGRSYTMGQLSAKVQRWQVRSSVECTLLRVDQNLCVLALSGDLT